MQCFVLIRRLRRNSTFTKSFRESFRVVKVTLVFLNVIIRMKSNRSSAFRYLFRFSASSAGSSMRVHAKPDRFILVRAIDLAFTTT